MYDMNSSDLAWIDVVWITTHADGVDCVDCRTMHPPAVKEDKNTE